MTSPTDTLDVAFPASGYQVPQYTQIPDLLLDYQMAHMSGAELKVALYICRRTFGFKKPSDTISFNQMLEGIVTHDGRRLDYGTGLSRDALAKAIKGLEAKQVILVVRSEDEKGSKQTNLYALNVGQATVPAPQMPYSIPPSPVERGSPKNGLGGSPKNGLGGSPKNGLGGSPKNGLTTNSSNNRQYNNRQNNSGDDNSPPPMQLNPDKQAVVVALTAVGVAEQVAARLASRYSEKRIREKLEYLEYLQEQGSVTRPAGWLRTAIEKDFAKPDGFMARVERERARHEEELQTQAELQAQVVAQAAVQTQTEVARRQRREQRQRVQRTYGTTVQDAALGESLLDALKMTQNTSSLLYSLLPAIDFLKWDGTCGWLAVPDKPTHDQLLHPGTQTAIKREMRFLLRETHPDLKLDQIQLQLVIADADSLDAQGAMLEHPPRPMALPLELDVVAPVNAQPARNARKRSAPRNH